MILKIALAASALVVDPCPLDKIIDKLEIIESGGDCAAVGDGGRAVGCLQIHPIMLRECNRILNREEFTLEDRKSRARSRQMAKIFLTAQYYKWSAKYKHRPGEDLLACAWNSGSIFKHVNIRYLEKYKRLPDQVKPISNKAMINQGQKKPRVE